MKFKLYDLITRSATSGLKMQAKNGSFPIGHDGPWNGNDTPLRTTAHWSIILLKAYDYTGDERFLNSVIRACNFIISKEMRPFGYTFYCRHSKVDRCNGLIGQAWVLEALIMVGLQLSEDKYLSVAKSVFDILPYNFNSHSWAAIDIDGCNLNETKTVNQQIWLSAMAMYLGKFTGLDSLQAAANDFVSNLDNKIKFFTDGLIKHNYTNYESLLKKRISQTKQQYLNRKEYLLQKRVSGGYLTFLLYGVAILIDYANYSSVQYRTVPEFMVKSVKYLENNYPYGFLEGPDSFKWSYNPVGIEMAYILQFLSEQNIALHPDKQNNSSEELLKRWIIRQFEGYYDFNENLLNKNTNDPAILSSRLYEAVRLMNYDIYL